jgi:hypothetical protein
MDIIKQIQEMINSINHNTSMGEFYIGSDNLKERVKESITRANIDKLIIENDLFYCHEEESIYFFQQLKGQVYNELLYRYILSIKNKKTLFKKLVDQCLIKELTFFIQDRKQTFFDMGKLLNLMIDNGFKIEEREYIKFNNIITEYDSIKYRNFSFRTVQSFKKWLTHYIPCNIDDILVKKQKDKYIVESRYLISIPYRPFSIKRLNIELNRIDTKFHMWDKIYEISDYKEKKLASINSELKRLNKILVSNTI